jgi:hypothetical protein
MKRMNNFCRKASAVVLGAVATTVVAASSAIAQIDTTAITLDASPLESMAPKVIAFVVVMVVIGAIIRLVRKAG